jgi:hypothetical protein
MNPRPFFRRVGGAIVLICTALQRLFAADLGEAPLGLFDGQRDVGAPSHPGSAQFDSGNHTYTVIGGGGNMWSTNDAIHMVWKKVQGDLTIASDIAFPKPGGNAHRKACLIVRQDLDTDSAYADAVLHGDGLTSLQYREAKGAMTREIQANVTGPRRLRLEKRGKYVSMSVAAPGESLHPAGGTFRFELQDPFYVGLAVCAHDDKVIEEAVFSELALNLNPIAPPNQRITSALETITLASKDRRSIWWTTNLIESPNWSHDNASIVFNSAGHLYRIPIAGGPAGPIDTGFATRCTSSHGLSPDGSLLAISDESQGNRQSMIYAMPVSGGRPRRITEMSPAYFGGWAPDGKSVTFSQSQDRQLNIYISPLSGGASILTTGPGQNDGPDFSHDGQYIYFHSDRSGKMQIWRMKSDGAGREQMTRDERNNWNPHPSPDGKSVVFLSYEPDVKDVSANQDVILRRLTLADGKIDDLAKIFGGPGTIDSPSWSPDSRKLAFVSRQFAP